MKGVSNISNASAEFLAQPTSQIDSAKTTPESQELLDKKMHIAGIHETGEEGNGGGEE